MNRILLSFLTIALMLPAAAAPARKKAAPQVNPDEQIDLAREAFDAYRFDDAAAALEKYETLRSKMKKPGEPVDYSDLERRITLGQSMLTRVESIVIVDSLTVDSADFFRHIHLAPTAGRLLPSSFLPAGFPGAGNSTVFCTERGDRLIWGTDSGTDGPQLVGTSMLADGTWEQPMALDIDMPEDFDPSYPFLMSDGVTIYFSSTGPESLGGRDIFISRDNGDGFLQPQNVGMPYNSTANDYLMAIDEMTGAGFWVTDRNCQPGKVTIFTFIPRELRKNYAFDTPDLIERAQVTSIKATNPDGTDYSSLLERIKANSRPVSSTERTSIDFAMPGGRIIRSLSDLKSPEARVALNDYLEARRELEQQKQHLARLRHTYGFGDTSVADEILAVELLVEQLHAALPRIANSVVTAESSISE